MNMKGMVTTMGCAPPRRRQTGAPENAEALVAESELLVPCPHRQNQEAAGPIVAKEAMRRVVAALSVSALPSAPDLRRLVLLVAHLGAVLLQLQQQPQAQGTLVYRSQLLLEHREVDYPSQQDFTRQLLHPLQPCYAGVPGWVQAVPCCVLLEV